MELLTLPQLAEAAAIPQSTARYFRDRFILFVPSVRVGRTVLHPQEAVDVLVLINGLAAGGATVVEIEGALERSFPVTVVTSQGVSGEVATAGPAGVLGELAHVLDERGARVESEMALLRDQIATSATSTQLEGVVFETRLAAHSIGERLGNEMSNMKANVEELRAQVSLLASRDQLEWIGDVVSAAISRTPGTGPSGTLEKKLIEIQDELQRPRPSDDVAELRVAVDRLAEHVSSRDKEFQRTLHALVNVMRTEVKTLQTELKEALADRPVAQQPAPVEVAREEPRVAPVEVIKAAPEPTEDSSSDTGKSRAPRRLGHPNRPAETIPFDLKSASGIEEAS